LQILPLSDNTPGRIKTIDNVIYYLQKKHSNVVVTPFETVIEGEFNELMTTLKECLELAGEGSNNIFANVKINYGDVLTIDEKISNTVNEKLDYGIKYFLDREKRKELLENAEKYGYSPKKIDELRVFIDEWNQDCVTNDVLDSFKVLEEFVKNNQEPYKGNIMYRFSKILSNEGRNSNEN